VGKGRDVGMQQIYKFEAKLSQGAAEQSISRDVSRMLNRYITTPYYSLS
jgi:callose synthase